MSAGMKPATRRAEQPVAACVHRWRIDEPSGPTVGARCRLCGAERSFATVWEPNATAWTREQPDATQVAVPVKRRPMQRPGDGLGQLEPPPKAECGICGLRTHWGAPMVSHMRKHGREGG